MFEGHLLWTNPRNSVWITLSFHLPVINISFLGEPPELQGFPQTRKRLPNRESQIESPI